MDRQRVAGRTRRSAWHFPRWIAVAGLGILAPISLHAQDPLPYYADHLQLTYYLDDTQQRHEVQSVADWLVRRDHVLQHVQAVMGPLP